MKKLLMSFGVLCMVCLLFCGTAMAEGTPTVTKIEGAAAEVEYTASDDGYKVTLTNAKQDGLYLVLIQKAQESQDFTKPTAPTKENQGDIFYMDVDAANGTNYTKVLLPKQMAEGTYGVYLSDYNADNPGAARGIATIKIGGSSGDVIMGDYDGDKNQTSDDVMKLIKLIVTGKYSDEELKVGDYDGDKKLTSDDVMTLIKVIITKK